MKAEAFSIIGGADGPTSVFIAGRTSGKKTLRVRIRQYVYKFRRKRLEKTIKADPHTLEEVIEYADKKYHLEEISKTKKTYEEQYSSAKEGLIIKYRPDLLGEFPNIPESEMPMDFHIYEIRIDNGRMEIQIDFKWDIFGMSYSGNKKTMKILKKISRELYTHYGVSEEDIKNRTKRYLSLLTVLGS